MNKLPDGLDLYQQTIYYIIQDVLINFSKKVWNPDCPVRLLFIIFLFLIILINSELL